ncbi:hypothetical protein JK232_04810 [Nissabacter archeti]|uniref:Uncharacterized protein n=1 Tax=Nissabacter archeti TaxID=1917880 RepID=A0ABS5JE31_9GAMM|nr:hypothetical protein [Nissabacter archeti]MBS0968210.1 hypothetical protein [Nissabacter archeti]
MSAGVKKFKYRGGNKEGDLFSFLPASVFNYFGVTWADHTIILSLTLICIKAIEQFLVILLSAAAFSHNISLPGPGWAKAVPAPIFKGTPGHRASGTLARRVISCYCLFLLLSGLLKKLTERKTRWREAACWH